MRDRVLLPHGIAAGSRSMRKLDAAITESGFETLNLAYPSCRLGLEDLVEVIHAHRDWIADHGRRTHVVTYSMGGLLARGSITRHRPPPLGRVVMLCPPSGDSEIADRLGGNFFYRRMLGPAGGELTTAPCEALTQLFGEVDYPLYPLGWLLIPGPHDGRVSVERTGVAGMEDRRLAYRDAPRAGSNPARRPVPAARAVRVKKARGSAPGPR